MALRFARTGFFLVVGIVAACDSTSVEGTGASGAAASGYASLVSFAGAGGCLDVKDGSSANGAPLQLWQCASGNTNQQWQFTGGTLKASNGKCLDVKDGVNANGAALQLWDCFGGTNQQWGLQADGTIRNAGGRCLDVKDNSNTNGAALQLWDCFAGTNQRWSTSASSGSSGASSSGSSSSGTTTPAGTGYSVANNHLYRNGAPYSFHGVNRDTLEWGANNWGGCGGDGHFADSDFQNIANWKATIVRLPLSQANWLGRRCDANAYRSMIDAAVAKAEAHGLDVVLDLHWSDVQGRAPCDGTCGGKYSGQQPMPDADSITFWKQVGARYGADPRVVFDLYNEPHPNPRDGVVATKDWDCWRNGGCTVTASTDASVTYTAVGMQALVDAARSVAPNTLLLAGGVDWSSDLSGIDAGYALSGSNIAYDIHVYTQFHNTTADWARAFGAAARNHAVTATEFGSIDCSSNVTTELIKYFDAPDGNAANRIGWLGWAWAAPGSCSQPSVIADWNGTPLAGNGKAIHDAMGAF